MYIYSNILKYIYASHINYSLYIYMIVIVVNIINFKLKYIKKGKVGNVYIYIYKYVYICKRTVYKEME